MGITNQKPNIMKLKVGHKLYAIREERKLNQQEMAELLHMTPSSYSRLERGETSAELEQLVTFSKQLDIPIQELLPEILSIHSNSQQGQGGLVFGNYYYSRKYPTATTLKSRLTGC